MSETDYTYHNSFILIATNKFNNKFNYNNQGFIKHGKIILNLVCSECGYEFEQIARSHLKSVEPCPNCRLINAKTEFIQKASILHKNFYDYSSIDYLNRRTKISILCPKHGIFKQTPDIHLKGCGCQNCYKDMQSNNKIKHRENFINNSSILHNNYYDYKLVEYVNSRTKVKIICPKHGIFKQTPDTHLKGCGCPKCANTVSTGEKELVKYIKEIYVGKIVENDRIQIKPKELDIYLPELQLAIEFNGEYWHRKHEQKTPGYHLIKENACLEKNIELVQVWYKDWKKNRNLIEQKIKNIILQKIKKTAA